MNDGLNFPDPADAHTIISDAATDRIRGSRAVAARAADGLARLADAHADPDALVPEFLAAARTLLVGQTAMAPVWRLVNDCLLAADAAEGPEFAADAIIDAAHSFATRQRRAAKALTHELAGYLPDGATVVTVSASSTLEDAFATLAAHGDLGRLRVLRSLPGGEGAAMADRLRNQRVHAEIVDDAAMGLAVEDADVVILGADAISADWCLNKVGSRPLARYAQAGGVPVIVVADTSKAVPAPLDRVIAAHVGTDPLTAVLERVAWREVRGWMSEDGLLLSASIEVVTGEIMLHPRLRLLADDLGPAEI